MTALLELAGVDKTFVTDRGPVHAVRSMSMAIGEGEVVGLVGESGSGKSTIANLVLGLEEADTGRIRFRGREVGEWLDVEGAGYRQAVQAVFQHPFQALDSRKRVGWLVAEPLVIHRRGNSRWRKERVEELMSAVHLDPGLVDRYPHQLSGGQAQRVNIARALALEPSLLVCDEPVSALDVSVQAQILNLLVDLQEQHELSFIFVAHDLSVVRHISHRVAVMYVGQMVELAPCDELFERPLHPYTAALLAAVPQPDPEQCSVFAPPPGEPPSSRNPPSGCYFHPRCPHAVAACRTERPEWRQLDSGRFVRCHLAEELSLAGVGEAGKPARVQEQGDNG